jgi:hypothetical protein
MLYLYVKTHNITGLKYLGKTSQNPHEYKGSGKRWKLHLKKHGNNVSTEVLLQTESKIELKETGIYYSLMWNVVESDQWANLKIEEGDGGGKCYNHNSNKINASKGGMERARLIRDNKIDATPWNKGVKIGPQSEETKKKKGASHTGMKRQYRPDGSWFWIKPRQQIPLPSQEP